jgi:glycine cleavage system transcriptional repressor
MKTNFLLIAGGVDRKGTVYNLTKILGKYSFNIEDSSMIMLRRTFSMIMLLSAENKIENSLFKGELKKFSEKHKMTVEIKKIGKKEMKEYPDDELRCSISISGADKPGIVNVMTKKLYEAGANIIDLETKSSDRIKPHAYYMFLEVSLPERGDLKKVRNMLVKEGKKLGVHVSMDEVDREIL